jgi:hypothetical protein
MTSEERQDEEVEHETKCDHYEHSPADDEGPMPPFEFSSIFLVLNDTMSTNIIQVFTGFSNMPRS